MSSPIPVTPPELDADEQRRMVHALRGALRATAGAPVVELIETHISYVLIAGEHAWKIKKALKNAFLDASTRGLREHLCAEELRLNRRLAPRLYLAVDPISGTPDRAQFGGSGPVLDHAVRMRAFAQEGLWDRQADEGRLGTGPIDELAVLLARFHQAAAKADPRGRLGSRALVRAQMLENLDDLARCPLTPAQGAALARLRDWESAAFPRLAPLMDRRLAQGWVRECHGDLHLGNVAQVDGHATVFDAIEFNDAFRWIDVASDVAFLTMDLQAHDRAALAHRLVDGWLQESGDHGALALLTWYAVHRALVRAKVAMMRAAQAGANDAASIALAGRYLALAERLGQPRRPALMITHGFSGSGKTTQTQDLLERIGAVRFRADVERKRLVGLAPRSRSGSPPGGGLYSAAMGEATHERLFTLAREALRTGWPVILDATFLSRRRRDQARAVARDGGVPFVILHVDADVAELRRRLVERARRGLDASEADEQVLEAQMRHADPLADDERADVFTVTTSPPSDAGPHGGEEVPGGALGVDWRPLLDRLA